MEGNILIIGDSLEVKLLRDALIERGLNLIFFSKKEFNLKKITTDLDVIVYELSYKETQDPSIIDEFLKYGVFKLIFLAGKADLEKRIEFIKKRCL